MASASVIHAAAASPPPPPLLTSPIPRTHLFSLPTSVSFSKPKLHLLPPVVSATAVGASTQFLLSLPPPPAASPPLSQPLYSENPSLLCSGALSSSRTTTDEYLHFLRLAVRYTDVELVRAVHCRILKLEEHALLSNTLIASYLKLGLISDAYGVFKGLSNPNVVSYTALVSGFAKSSRELEAVGLFSRMRNSGIEPNEFTFVAILTACIRILELELGLQVHALAVKLGYLENVFVSNALMGLYSKCGCSDFALQLFGKMSERDAASWNVVISSALNELMYDRAVELIREMWDTDGLKADYITLSTLLAACTDNSDSSRGREIHAQAIRAGIDSRLSLSNAIISFYRKCGNQKAVEYLFNKMIVRDVISWTEMITAYMEFGLVDMAMAIFNRMPEKNAISYNTLLAGLCENGEASCALDLFIHMLEKGLELTEFTLTTVVKACGSLIDKKLSEQIQGFVTKFGLRENVHVEAALLDMCTRCGRMGDAEFMFTGWSYNDVISIPSTSMICGYARNGQPDEAISLFSCCQSEGTLVMDEVASTSVLGVCGTLGFHEMGQQIHCHAIKSGTVSHLELANAVVSMYSKCWNLNDALKVFRVMPIRDVASWNGLIAGHLLHWQGDEALLLWSKMKKLGIKPDKITFLLLLSAYKHTKSTLVDECHNLFLSMRTEYNVEPSQEHYACLVGVFSFWGFLERAYEVISDMPFRSEPLVWRALLDGCIIHSDTDLGKKAVKQLLSMDPQDPSSYILTANLYSAHGRWQCADEVRAEMKQKGIQKFPARSWVIHQNKIVPFYTRDKSHPQAKDIYSGLDILILECLKAGYVPDTRFVLQEVEEHQKEHFLFYHSAKLAAAFGLLMSRPGKPIKIVKNICVCRDCHSFLKYASAVTNREILLRDSSGFHHFVDGHCSCRDRR